MEVVVQVDQVIKEHLVSEFMQDRPDFVLTEDTPLIDMGIVDSLGIFLLVDFIRDRFGIRVEPSEVTLDNFGTIAAIRRLIATKLG